MDGTREPLMYLRDDNTPVSGRRKDVAVETSVSCSG